MSFDREWLLAARGAVGGFRHGDFGLVPVDESRVASADGPTRPDPVENLPGDFWLRRSLFAVRRRDVPLGQLSVALFDERGGRPYLEIRRFILRPEIQGQGLAKALQQHLDRCLPGLGIERVRVDAAGVGGFAWARLGYDFDLERYGRMARYRSVPPEQLRVRARAELLESRPPHEWPIAEECGGGVAPASAPDSVSRLLNRLAAISDRNARVVGQLRAQLGGEDGASLGSPAEVAGFARALDVDGLPEGSWLGREIMIRASWIGVRVLPLGSMPEPDRSIE